MDFRCSALRFWFAICSFCIGCPITVEALGSPKIPFTKDAQHWTNWLSSRVFHSEPTKHVSKKECAPLKVDHLVVWQVYSNPSDLIEVNAHNMNFLPVGTEIKFVEHHHGLLKHARYISNVLERCRNITGFYDSFVMIRAVATRANMLRAALLWHYGGLWMDHKTVLATNLSRIIHLTSDHAVLPVEEKFGEQNFRVLTLALGAGALAKTIL